MEASQLPLPLGDLANGSHERCGNPTCRGYFPLVDNKFQRVKGLDGRWYCDSHCASGPYLTSRDVTGW